MQIDFLARSLYLVDHLIPIYKALPIDEQGVFYAMGDETYSRLIQQMPASKVYKYIDDGDCGHNPIVTAAYGDALRAANFDDSRPVILFEHGVGLTFGKAAYADGLGQRHKFYLMPVQSNYVLQKVHNELLHIPHPIVGMPKLDWLKDYEFRSMPDKPLIVFAFHHGDKNSRPAEIGSAWEHYYKMLPALSNQFKIAFHRHPTGLAQTPQEVIELLTIYNIPIIEEFTDVMKQADILVNDCGSAAYEFIATGKPVILLNAPWFNKKTQWGIRFWDYSNIGWQVENPEDVQGAIERTIENPDQHRIARQKAVKDLLPFIGESVVRAVDEIQKSLSKPIRLKRKDLAPEVVPVSIPPKSRAKPTIPQLDIRTSSDQGILYMAFGAKAVEELYYSVLSLRRTGSTLPVAVVIDNPAALPYDFANDHLARVIMWQGENPFEADKAEHFQFRAGKVKPFFYDISPFKETLYVDCDVEFLLRPDDSFGFLKNWDFVICQERLMLSELYNQRGVRWLHDIEERDYTVEQFGGNNGDFPFWNSGVFWWKKNDKVRDLFKHWYSEWLIFEGWDEQKALMRAGNVSNARIFVLGEIWNYPHREDAREKYHQKARNILHEYGTGSARSEAKDVMEVETK